MSTLGEAGGVPGSDMMRRCLRGCSEDSVVASADDNVCQEPCMAAVYRMHGVANAAADKMTACELGSSDPRLCMT